MTLIQKMQNYIGKKRYFSISMNFKYFRIQKFSPIIIFIFLAFFTSLFFVSYNLILNKNKEYLNNFEEIKKKNEFYNLSNFLISKINSPYEEINYNIKNNDTVEKIFKKFNIRS